MVTATGIMFTTGVGAFLGDFFRQVPVRAAVVGPPGDPVPSPSVA
jgi:hypothetical protein